MSKLKYRLDRALVTRGLVPSRQQAQTLIAEGMVRINRLPATKAATLVDAADHIELTGSACPYVSRGGIKLAAALEALALDVTQLICMDVGASTGGFCDCLLQHGARRVFAVDVGYGQLAWRLRQDPRVEVVERTNIRHLETDRIGVKLDLITIDVSFISLRIVVPAVEKFTHDHSRVLALIKPQFEVGKGHVGKGGVVKSPSQHDTVITELKSFFKTEGFVTENVVPSPILGPKGNKEFFILLKWKL